MSNSTMYKFNNLVIKLVATSEWRCWLSWLRSVAQGLQLVVRNWEWRGRGIWERSTWRHCRSSSRQWRTRDDQQDDDMKDG